MKKLHFNSAEDFQGAFEKKAKHLTDAIVQGIQDAIAAKRRTAHIFEISFDSSDVAFEISLPSSQWKNALEKCLEHYHELELVDEQIDTWKILESVK